MQKETCEQEVNAYETITSVETTQCDKKSKRRKQFAY